MKLRKEQTEVVERNRLETAIRDRGLKVSFIAKQLGLCRSALYLKMQGKRKFRKLEIEKLVEILHLTSGETEEIFPQAA